MSLGSACEKQLPRREREDMKGRLDALSIWSKVAVLSSAVVVATQPMAPLAKGEPVQGRPDAGPSQGATSAAAARESRPNIVYIVLDDVGFSDLGSYGSEIRTPNIDRLAANGLIYNNFNVTPLSSPTRACLLTGRDNNAVGMGFVANFDLSPTSKSITGRINPAAATVAEILRDQGYSTLGVGKWHLAPLHQATPAGPFENWPLGKGFERYYGFLDGETDQFSPQLFSGNQIIDPPKRAAYHVSEDLIDRAKQFVTDVTSVYPEKPFFLYVAFGAGHSPHQVPQQYMEMYKGVYSPGWDRIRQDRFNRQKNMGLIPASTVLAPKDPTVKEWDNLTKEEQEVFLRFQQAYAGFITHTDEQIGNLLDFLRSIGKLDNTLIVVLSDNGATSDGGPDGIDTFARVMNRVPVSVDYLRAHVNEIGGPEMQALYPKGWGQASNTPFQNYKGSTYSGGTHVPLIIHWPTKIDGRGKVRTQYVHVMDITPTVLDLLGLKAPETYHGVKQMPMHGISMAYTFNDPDAAAKRTIQYYLMANSRAIYKNGWKAIATHKQGQPFTQDAWELYHVSEDYSESRNVGDTYPDELGELKELWQVEAGRYGALPLKEMGIAEMSFVNPESAAARTTFTYLPGTGHVGTLAAPRILNRSYTITVPVTRPDRSSDGVLVSHGDHLGGYSLFIQNNRLVYEYNNYGALYRIESGIDMPTGKSIVKFEFTKTGFYAGTGSLYIDNRKVGEAVFAKTILTMVSFEGLDVGRDSLSPVSTSYKDHGEFPFTGSMESVTFHLKNDFMTSPGVKRE
jgi:arylsulfatase A-like enzyme